MSLPAQRSWLRCLRRTRTLRSGAILLALGMITMALACESSTDTRPPNIILVISDDHGWPDFGFMGSEVVKTPNIDTLAEQGFVFSHAYNTASTCRASLQTLLTGFHPFQVDARARAVTVKRKMNIGENLKILLFKTLPDFLSEKDYASFQAGKYWEGSFDMGGFTHGMSNAASDSSGEDPENGSRAGDVVRAFGRESMQPLWDFFAEHQRERADKPFFIWFAPMLPHGPFDAPKAYRDLYRDMGLSEPEQAYYANVSRFDTRVGELLEHLDANDLRDDTMIVFLTDNGWEAARNDSFDQRTFGGPGGKASLAELGFRTPIVFSWPGHIQGGTTDSSLVSTTDLFPTLLDFAGIETPSDRPGESLRSLIDGVGGRERTNIMARLNVLRSVSAAGGSPRNDDPFLNTGFLFRNLNWSYGWAVDDAQDRLYRVIDGEATTEDVAKKFPQVLQRLRKRIGATQERLIEAALRSENGVAVERAAVPATGQR